MLDVRDDLPVVAPLGYAQVDQRGGLVALPIAVSTISCSGRNQSTAGISIPTACSSASFSTSRLAAARRIAAIAASPRIIRPAFRHQSSWRLKRSSPRHARPKTEAPRATAWARPGATQNRATWMPSSKWSGAVKALGLEDLHHARDARPRSVGPAQRGRARLLQPQYRYLGALSIQGDVDANLSDRLETLENVRAVRHESVLRRHSRHGRRGEADRVDMLVTLANLPEPPESVPINMLIPIAGTPLAEVRPDRADRVRPASLRWRAS